MGPEWLMGRKVGEWYEISVCDKFFTSENAVAIV